MGLISKTGCRYYVRVNNIPDIKKRMHTNANRIVRKATFDIEAGSKMRAPVDTGNLVNSIQAAMLAPLHGRIRVGADYGVYVHEGTRFMPARPFMRTTFELIVPQFVMAMRKVFQ